MKKNTNILIAMLCMISVYNAQSEKSELSLIRGVLMDYIEGTSYNKVDQINRAFYPDANLYLDGKDGTMNVMPISEYMGFFTNKTPGEFNGRIGRIISLDQFGNIGMAKAEILIPAIQKKYIDMFILKKVDDSWKIISKTANSEKSDSHGDKILFIVSNTEYYGSTEIPTGNSFAEIVYATDEFVKSGYAIDVVSPLGGAIPLSHINTSDSLQSKYIYDSDFMYGLKNSLRPGDINPKDYKAVYFVGGGSAVFDVPVNKPIQRIAMEIYEEHKGIISSVCHGTAGIVNLKTKDGKYLYENIKVSGYPDDYEAKDKTYYQQFPIHIQETIEARGGQFVYADRNTEHVEVQGRVITGQNHLSSRGVAKMIVKELNKEE